MNVISPKKVAIATLGCKVNQYDSILLEECFKKENFNIVPIDEAADIYIVNSCTVTAKADQEANHLLRRFQKKNPNATLVMTGCFAQVASQKLSQSKNIHYIVGNTLKTKLPELLKYQKDERPNTPQIHIENAFKNPSMPYIPISTSQKKTRVFFKIQDGCDDFCTFCIIPYARGKSRSLEPKSVISQIQALVQEGVKEIVLTGVSLGSYGVDLTPKTSLAKLVQAIGAKTPLLRLRISSLEPEDVDDNLLEALKNSSQFCPHFHLPLQAGNDVILSKMKRNYSVDYYKKLLTKISKDFKDVFIGTDVMCGFPGEEESHFQNTYQFLKDLPWSKLHVFPYSPRSGTPAAKFGGQLTRSAILKRGKLLQTLSQERHQEYLTSFIGKNVLALVEKNESKKSGFYKALTRNYLPIYFQSNNSTLLNEEMAFKILTAEGENLLAEKVRSY